MACFHFMAFSIINILTICMSANAVQSLNINMTSHVPFMDLADEQQIFAENVGKLLEFITSKGCRVTFGEAWRTQEQALIYAHNGKGIKKSLHCERLAIDLNIFDKNDKLLTTVAECEMFGVYWESLHPFNVWGGHWKNRPDSDHYQMSDER